MYQFLPTNFFAGKSDAKSEPGSQGLLCNEKSRWVFSFQSKLSTTSQIYPFFPLKFINFSKHFQSKKFIWARHSMWALNNSFSARYCSTTQWFELPALVWSWHKCNTSDLAVWCLDNYNLFSKRRTHSICIESRPLLSWRRSFAFKVPVRLIFEAIW